MADVAGGQRPDMSTREAAAVAGVNERTIRRVIASGRLVATATAGGYRITPEALADWRARRPTTAVRDEERPVYDAAWKQTPDATQDALIETLQSEVAYLRQQLDHQTHIIAGLVRRLPELPADTAVREMPQERNPATLRDETPVQGSTGLIGRVRRLIGRG